MSDRPVSKRQKVTEEDEEEDVIHTPKAVTFEQSPRAITPRNLLGSENRSVLPTGGSQNLQIPSLLPPESLGSARGRDFKSYSQSPPRSPGRSPTRRLKLIELSPIKNSRAELQKLYESKKLDVKKERLFIHQLVLNDFKSYAGRQVIGPFHTSFSAIVGPNGSGKSNVIDSMLFVFGFRANKMRQDRLSDLIHKSETFPDLKSCSVEVHFKYVIDKDDGSTTIDETKGNLVVTRKAFKNNASKYFVNGRESNYTEVTTLLKKEGIDLDHKRFLILQGEVENIAQMKAKAEKENDDGLLEYLEDIIGTSKYKESIEKLSMEIESLNEICVEKENRFSIVEREKNSLESGKEEALQFLNKEKELVLEKSKLYQYNLMQDNKKLDDVLNKKTNVQQEQTKQEDEFRKANSHISDITASLNVLKADLEKVHTEEVNLSKTKRTLENKKVENEQIVNNLDSKRKEFEEQSKILQDKINSTDQEIQTIIKEQSSLAEGTTVLSTNLDIEKEKLENIKLKLREKTEHLTIQIAEYEKELSPWNEQSQQLKKEIKITESELSIIEENRKGLENDIAGLENAILSQKRDLEVQEQEIKSLLEQKTKVIQERELGERECKNAQATLANVREKVEALRQKAIEIRSTYSATENNNKVLSALLRLQKSGRLNGFHGRLGDLAVIDPKYDVAISTACPRLNDLVVDTVESGQQCIEYLRKNKLGYARFILLDKLNTFNTNRIDTPDQSQRLFDLITVKEKRFNNAFYSVLRDTLVCQNMEQANRVAYGKKRYRVVTLDGNLIDLSGTMTGGGRNVSKGLMKLSKSSSKGSAFFSPEEVQAIENELNQKENQYKSALDAYHEMEEELRRLRDRAPEIDNLVSKKEMDIETAHNDINSNINVLEEKRKKLESMKNQNDPSITLLAKLKELKSKLDDIDVQTKSTKDKIKTIKDKIIELGGDELKNQSLLVTDITNKISENSRRLKKIKSNKLKKESLLKKFNKELTEANEELTNFSKNAENADIESKEIESKLLDIKESIENLKENEVKLEHEIEMKHNELESHQKVVSDYKSISLEYNNKLEKLEASEASLKKSIKGYNDLLSELTIRDVTQVLNTIMTEENASVDKSDPKLENTSAVINADDDGISAVSENQSFNHNDENDDIDSNKMEIDSQGGFINPGIPVLSASELAKVDPQEVELLITSLDDFITSSEANVDVLEEYALRFVEFNKRKNDLNSAVQSRDSVKDRLEGIKRKRYDEFMEGFKIISMTLKEMYQMITLGGNAELELVDSLDPFSEGVTFSVMPPKKSWRNISNLSGGEKTLSSLALVFALHKYKPTPLYVMDEIDAALDFRNVSIVANYIKERTKNAQFIVISLRNNMFELTKQLVGIYKHENMTKSAALVNEDLVGRA